MLSISEFCDDDSKLIDNSKYDYKLHLMCKSCLRESIKSSESFPIECPGCEVELSDYMCYEILKKEDHGRYRQRRMEYRYAHEKDLYPCNGTDCNWAIKRNNLLNNQSKCPRCGTTNCYRCRDAHSEQQTCEMWLSENADRVEARRLQAIENEKKIQENKAIYCPQCGIFIEFLGGCDWLSCPACGHEICFRMKMSRWGPKGHGDTTGGCRCLADGQTKCHPECADCH